MRAGHAGRDGLVGAPNSLWSLGLHVKRVQLRLAAIEKHEDAVLRRTRHTRGAGRCGRLKLQQSGQRQAADSQQAGLDQIAASEITLAIGGSVENGQHAPGSLAGSGNRHEQAMLIVTSIRK